MRFLSSMNKPLTTLALFSTSLFLLAGCRRVSQDGVVLVDEEVSSASLLGGDRDEHGCIGSAGYQWCEAKQKCLRIWEEPCEEVPAGAVALEEEKYTSESLGFTLQFPSSWAGFKATEGSDELSTYVGFSFHDGHQPFEIFRILRLPRATWEALQGSVPLVALLQSGDAVLACDGCCSEGGDTRGGGQFDAFQQERCAEVPSVLRSLRAL